MTATDLVSPTSRETICQHCGAGFRARRASARYCSARCRLAAHRAEQQPVDASPKAVVTELRRRGMVGQVWPVYRWQDDAPVFGLLVPRGQAAEELSAAGFTVSDADLRRLLRDQGVADYGEKVEEQRIKHFYETRRNRRVEAQEVKR